MDKINSKYSYSEISYLIRHIFSFKSISVVIIYFLICSMSLFSQDFFTDTREYDFSGLEPITPEAFVRDNFSYLEEKEALTEEEVFIEEIPQQSSKTIKDPEKVSNNVKIPTEISHIKSNKLPTVNFKISTVSGGSFEAPVWIKFYPSGTYDPDGYIVLFEMDMDGDGTYDVSERTLTGGSFEFTTPGKYTTTVRVTDDRGGVTVLSKSFTISDPNSTYVELPKVYQQVEERNPEEIIVDDKLDSIIAEYKQQDEISTTTSNEIDIVHQEPIKKAKKSPKLILKSEKRSEEKVEMLDSDAVAPFKSEKVDLVKNEFEKVNQINIQMYPIADAYVYAYSYRNWNEANFGKHNVLSAGWHSTGGEKRSYIKFDMPNIDPETLSRAVLKLYHQNTIGKNSLTIGIHQVLEYWEEGIGTFHSGHSEPIDSSGAIIWKTQPAFNDSTIIQFKPKKKSKRWVEIDITTIVKEWLKGTPNNGLVLRTLGPLSGRSPISIYEFYSREYEDVTKAPVLELHVKE